MIVSQGCVNPRLRRRRDLCAQDLDEVLNGQLQRQMMQLANVRQHISGQSLAESPLEETERLQGYQAAARVQIIRGLLCCSQGYVWCYRQRALFRLCYTGTVCDSSFRPFQIKVFVGSKTHGVSDTC